MALDIATFSNTQGGFPFFKAAGHPAVAPRARDLMNSLADAGRVGVYDPLGFATPFAELFPFDKIDVAHVFVQDLGALGTTVLNCAVQPVTDLPKLTLDALLIVAFDAGKLARDIAHLLPDGVRVETLDTLRLPDDRLTDPENYLNPLNFATNFAWFRDTGWDYWIVGTETTPRDAGRLHTRIATANYWHRYGARDVLLWCLLLDENGERIAEWDIALPDSPGGITIDSQDVRSAFKLGDFTGQLFFHAIGVKGHDVVKYALDLYGDASEHGKRALTCTHDANSWPADFYGGLPAPKAEERVVLWVQNSHPCAIPPGAIGLNLMGDDDKAVWLDKGVPPFGTLALDVSSLLPSATWPQQIEIRAGKYFVRPRYEIEAIAGGVHRRRMAHANVERTDLQPNPTIPGIGALMGKGYLLPAPVLPAGRFRSIALPTPMARSQRCLPTKLLIYDPDGQPVAQHALGNVARSDSVAVDLDQVLNGHGGDGGGNFAGHMELVYDFDAMGESPEDGVDGWLHALFRYEMRDSGHAAETSFGAHIFNTALTFRNEPQSYSGSAPGLTTRLFLRVEPNMTADEPALSPDSFCQLIYPASTAWHTTSKTTLTLFDGAGTEVASRLLEIPCGGSRLWYLSETFDADERRAAAGRGAPMAGDGRAGGYVMIRDTTCRLFGYHGLMTRDGSAFSLDHMFGF
ncbi:MAG: hypothetical protein VW644_04185 [Alphaproteobacteria bacterium]|jgi:hypothetical protein